MLCDRLFPEILALSQTGTLVILAVLLLRFLFRRSARRQTVVIWLAAAFALCCPLKLETPLAAPISTPAAASPAEIALPPQLTEQIPTSSVAIAAYQAVGDTLNGGLDVIHMTVHPSMSYVPAAFHDQVWLLFFSRIWLPVAVLIAAAAVFSLWKLKRRLAVSVPCPGKAPHVFLCDSIDTALTLGVFRPRMYLPSALSDEDRTVIIAHECTHIAYRDPALKLLAFLLLCIHWFNPFVWIAFSCFSDELELRCDEKTVATLSIQKQRDAAADYADTLLRLSPRKRRLSLTLGFAENSTKKRILHALQSPKANRLTGMSAVLLCALLILSCTFAESRLIDANNVTSVLHNGAAAEPEHGDMLIRLINESSKSVNRMYDAMEADVLDHTVVITEKNGSSVVLCHKYAAEEPDGFRSTLTARNKNGDVTGSYLYDDDFDRAFAEWLGAGVSIAVTHGDTTDTVIPLKAPRDTSFDYNTVSALYVRGDAVITVRGYLGETVQVSEDYYEKLGSERTRILKETYELTPAADENTYVLPVTHRNPGKQEQAIYYIGGAETRYIFTVTFLPKDEVVFSGLETQLQLQNARTLLHSLSTDKIRDAAYSYSKTDLSRVLLPLADNDTALLCRLLQNVRDDDITVSPQMLYGVPDVMELTTDDGCIVTVYYLDVNNVQVYTEETGMLRINTAHIPTLFHRVAENAGRNP